MKKYHIEECSNGWIVYMTDGPNDRPKGCYVFHVLKNALDFILSCESNTDDSPPF